jgi:hypothetical protein
MPCLNEAETVATCVRKARAFLAAAGVEGEVVVADNGSTDGSPTLAEQAGARVVHVDERGYGSALMGGIRAAQGRYVIMGDADDSYDFTALQPFLDRLRAGDDLVMGNRFAGGIAPGAMPALHRYLGNPVLSFVGRLLFKAPVGDFHCGLRGFDRAAVLGLDLRTTGMEWASEVVVRATLSGLVVSEVPTTLSPDGRTRPPHLRSFRDGWRHLRFLLIFSPRWLFLYPGLAVMAAGLLATVLLVAGPISLGSVTFDVGTLLLAVALTIVGYQSVLFAVLTKVYAVSEGLMPSGRAYARIEGRLSLERMLGAGALVFLVGIVAAVAAFWRWRDAGFGELDAQQTVRTLAPALLGMVLGVQTILFGLFKSILGVRLTTTRPTVPTALFRAEVVGPAAPVLAAAASPEAVGPAEALAVGSEGTMAVRRMGSNETEGDLVAGSP